jgi:thymidine kinase
MFSGKTEELIRRINRALIAGLKVEIFKPTLDNRYGQETIVSHDKRKIRSTMVNFAEDILLYSGGSQLIAVDEAQFFDEAIVDVCVKLANSGKRVIIAGLDMDYSGKPFGSMPELMTVAEYITKLHAICARCGSSASFSYRLNEKEQQVLVGEKDLYEPRCRSCFLNKYE